ncbi:MAG: ParB/RepB/Spo0J family partition protein [Caulobacteraceae bacterium]
MAARRRGLGRGLSALIEEARGGDSGTGDSALAGGTVDLPIELVRPNPRQPRRAFAEADMEELAASIRAHGVLQPILVRPSPERPGEYQIVAGERRWRAAQRAKLHVIPAVARPIADDEVMIVALVENLQRADLNPIEEARAYGELLEQFDGPAALADAVGKSRSHIANTVRLLRLPASVRENVEAGVLSAGHARAVAAAADPERLARVVLDRGLSVRQAEALARRDRAPRESKRLVRVKDADTAALEQDVSEALGLTVEIADAGGAGQMRIRYGSLEQLDDLCRRLTRR